jgi:hypothetical protein
MPQRNGQARLRLTTWRIAGSEIALNTVRIWRCGITTMTKTLLSGLSALAGLAVLGRAFESPEARETRRL